MPPGRARPRRGSTGRRSASMSSARPSSRSPWRWRWTAASSSRWGRCTIARDALHVAGRTINDTHPFGRACSVAEIMKESSNIGTAQIADQLGPTRQKEFLRKMGFLDKVNVELKERGRTLTPGQPLEPDRNDDGRLRPRHRGHAAASRHRLCDAVQRRHLPPGDLAQGRQATMPAGKGHRVFSEETSYKMRALLRLVVTEGHRQEGRRARLSRRRQDRHRREDHRRPLIAGGDDRSPAFSRWTSRAM